MNSSAASNRAPSASHPYISSTSGVSSSTFATNPALQTTLWPQDANINIHTNNLGNELQSWQPQTDFTRYTTSAPLYTQSLLGTSNATSFAPGLNSRSLSFPNSSFHQSPQRPYLPRMSDYPSPHSEISEQTICSPNITNNNNFVAQNGYLPPNRNSMSQSQAKPQDQPAANASPPRNANGDIYCADPACRNNPPTFARKCEWT